MEALAAYAAALNVPAKAVREELMADWDIRLQCTRCGQRKRRCRSDGNPPYGREPPATTWEVCYQCSEDLGRDEVCTLHFIDYATDRELAEFKS
jgi:hypothetical protein